MSTKAQWQRMLMRKVWINKTGSTADRTTEADDVRVNDHAWKLADWMVAPRSPRMRKDIIA